MITNRDTESQHDTSAAGHDCSSIGSRCDIDLCLCSSSMDDASGSIVSAWWKANVYIPGKCAAFRPAMTTASVCRTIPWVVLSFGLAQIIVFLGFTDYLHKWLAFSAKADIQIWRYFTYSLLHSTPIHLGINLIVQLMVGIPLELEQGHLRTLFVYLGSTAAGALTSSWYHPEQTLVGASAGAFGLLTSHLPHTLLNFDVLSYRYYRLSAVAIFAASDLIDSTVSNAVSLWLRFEQPRTISKCAHLGGAVAGILLGFSVYSGHRGLVLEVLRVVVIALWVAVMIYLVFESNQILA